MEGAVVGATVQVILDKVLKVAAEEISLVWGLKEDLKSLSDTVTMIQAVLDDAGRRQVNDKAVELWLMKLKDVAYEADDVLDEFTCEILRRKVEIPNQIYRKGISCCISSLQASLQGHAPFPRFRVALLGHDEEH